MVYGSQHNVLLFLLLSILPPQRPTRTARLVPYTTHFRSEHARLSYSDRRAAVKTAALNRARFWGRLWPLCHCQTRLTIWSVRDRSRENRRRRRSEEHPSELQSLMRISYAVFCLKKKKYTNLKDTTKHSQSQQLSTIYQPASHMPT